MAAPQSDAPVPHFLADLAGTHLGAVVAVHTGRQTYVGQLVSINGACLVLDADSESLDQPVYTRIETARIEAIELVMR